MTASQLTNPTMLLHYYPSEVHLHLIHPSMLTQSCDHCKRYKYISTHRNNSH